MDLKVGDIVEGPVYGDLKKVSDPQNYWGRVQGEVDSLMGNNLVMVRIDKILEPHESLKYQGFCYIRKEDIGQSTPRQHPKKKFIVSKKTAQQVPDYAIITHDWKELPEVADEIVDYAKEHGVNVNRYYEMLNGEYDIEDEQFQEIIDGTIRKLKQAGYYTVDCGEGTDSYVYLIKQYPWTREDLIAAQVPYTEGDIVESENQVQLYLKTQGKINPKHISPARPHPQQKFVVSQQTFTYKFGIYPTVTGVSDMEVVTTREPRKIPLNRDPDKDELYDEMESDFNGSELEQYIHDETLKNKVESIRMIGLYAGNTVIVEVKTNQMLNENEIKAMTDYINGQCSDGWGEGYEQHDTAIRDKFVSTWNANGKNPWFIGGEKAKPMEHPKQKFMVSQQKYKIGDKVRAAVYENFTNSISQGYVLEIIGTLVSYDYPRDKVWSVKIDDILHTVNTIEEDIGTIVFVNERDMTFDLKSPPIEHPKQKFVVSQLFGKPKYKIGDTIGVGVDDDGETVYLEGKIDDTTAQIVQGQTIYMYYVRIMEDNDWIPMGKRDWFEEGQLAAEPSPITARKKGNLMERIMKTTIAQVTRDDKGLPTGKIQPTQTLDEAQQIIQQAGTQEEVQGKPSIEPAPTQMVEAKPVDRKQQVKDSLQDLYKQIDDIGVAIYQMKLTDPQLQELTGKVVDQISNTISEITIQRVKDIAPEFLGPNK